MSDSIPPQKEWAPGEWPVIGHGWAVELLAGAVATGRMRHAYLFTGPQAIGKTTVAMVFAQALLCEREEKPCGQCLPCRKVQRGVHPDLRVVEPGYGEDQTRQSGEAKSLGIDAVRALRGDSALTPFEGVWKIFLIPEAESMTPESQNALLKTLEEPPRQVVILLTALREESLLPTIVSRCQVFNLRPLPLAAISAALQDRWGVAKEKADLLASLSGGRMGWALTALQDDSILAEREERLAELLRLSHADRLERLSIAARWAQKPREAVELLELWLGWWRDLLMVRAGNQSVGGTGNFDSRKILEQEGARYSVAQISEFLASLERTIAQVERNANLRLALEVLMLDLPSGG